MIHVVDKNNCPLNQNFSIMLKISHCLRNFNRVKIFAMPFKLPTGILEFY